VCHYRSGGSFGELALMYNAPRAATITCCAGSVTDAGAAECESGQPGAALWCVDRDTFRRVIVLSRAARRSGYERSLAGVPLPVNVSRRFFTDGGSESWIRSQRLCS